MTVGHVMSHNPIGRCLQDSVQTVACMLRDQNIGSVPVIRDHESNRRVGIITDRDLCCRILAEGHNPMTTLIEAFITRDPVTSKADQSVASCTRLMQVPQIQRIVVSDAERRCIGIVSQADVARSLPPDGVHKTVAEISRPAQIMITPAA
jgi:CBS domain-containing protein